MGLTDEANKGAVRYFVRKFCKKATEKVFHKKTTKEGTQFVNSSIKETTLDVSTADMHHEIIPDTVDMAMECCLTTINKQAIETISKSSSEHVGMKKSVSAPSFVGLRSMSQEERDLADYCTQRYMKRFGRFHVVTHTMPTHKSSPDLFTASFADYLQK